MASRIGRRGASETYPTRGGVYGLGAPYARNSAFGPAATMPVTAAQEPISFSSIESGGAGTNVPITPQVSGDVLVTGTVECSSLGDSDQLTVQVGVGGVALPHPVTANFVPGEEGAKASVSFQTVIGLPIGTTSNINVFVNANSNGDIQLDAFNSRLSIQEVPTATG